MTKIEEFLSQWRDSREVLIKEVERIIEPALTERFRRLTSPNG